ncbi:MAG: hypothetical protein Q8S39_11845 [Ignavibacteria bacterium]|nr:hypothetical protein [Ignavibacteria bacterium]
MKKFILTILLIAMFTTLAISQDLTQKDSVSVQIEKQDINRRHYIGSSLFLLGNLAPGDPPYYFQLNYGYQLTPKDIIIVEAITWTYYGPIGLATFGSTQEKLYPGKVRAYGLGVGYQRFHWKNLYTTVQATPLLQQFFDSEDKKIQNGFQLYLQFILGYRFEFFNKRLFVEPAYALKYWPVNTNFPASFAAVESGAPKFKFEPSLNFGFRF